MGISYYKDMERGRLISCSENPVQVKFFLLYRISENSPIERGTALSWGRKRRVRVVIATQKNFKGAFPCAWEATTRRDEKFDSK